jgi:hypothetical protein
VKTLEIVGGLNSHQLSFQDPFHHQFLITFPSFFIENVADATQPALQIFYGTQKGLSNSCALLQ